jgi:hypothetical protein
MAAADAPTCGAELPPTTSRFARASRKRALASARSLLPAMADPTSSVSRGSSNRFHQAASTSAVLTGAIQASSTVVAGGR